MGYRHRHHRHRYHVESGSNEATIEFVFKILFGIIALPLVGLYLLFKGNGDRK